MAAGMSTPALRDIARSVDIQHAAFPEITGAIFLFVPFATNALTMTVVSFFYNERLWYRAGLAGVSVLSRLGLLFLLCRSDWDEQRFILKVMNKFLFHKDRQNLGVYTCTLKSHSYSAWYLNEHGAWGLSLYDYRHSFPQVDWYYCISIHPWISMKYFICSCTIWHC